MSLTAHNTTQATNSIALLPSKKCRDKACEPFEIVRKTRLTTAVVAAAQSLLTQPIFVVHGSSLLNAHKAQTYYKQAPNANYFVPTNSSKVD